MIDIHPQLQKDTIHIGHFPLCHLLMSKDANYPWFILVPNRKYVTEIFQLSHDDQLQLISESSYLANVLMYLFKADKMNVAALGNVVPQLHLHHIVRYSTDAAWPDPVWGKVPAVEYTSDGVNEVIDKLRGGLTRDFLFDVGTDSDAEIEG